MRRIRSVQRLFWLGIVCASPLAAQSTTKAAVSTTPSSPAAKDDAGESAAPLTFGVAGGALSYQGGREEQALGAVLRWSAMPWIAFEATPTMIRVREPSATALGTMQTTSGIADLPVEATLSHAFHLPLHPSAAIGFGVSLPLGDTATGFGAGAMGYSGSAGLGFAPVERLWVHLGAGRSLTDVSMRSAFSTGSGWGDVSAGVALSERLSVNGGYSSDIGAVDTTVGRSTSVNGGLALAVYGPATLNLNASHGVSGLAPRWSFAFGFGTAFPYLNHLGAGSSPIDELQQTFGGGTHGLGNGSGNGSGNGNSSGKGKGRKSL